MMLNPRIGQLVEVRYRKERAASMFFHGMVGVVVARSSGRPRNHLIRVAGTLVVVPCGNLMKAGEQREARPR